MFQILTLTKRMDAAETGIEKTISLLQDLAREQSTALSATGGEPNPKLEEILQKAEAYKSAIEVTGPARRSFTKFEGADLAQRLEALENYVNELSETVNLDLADTRTNYQEKTEVAGDEQQPQSDPSAKKQRAPSQQSPRAKQQIIIKKVYKNIPKSVTAG